jgi:hypothetical protein
MDRMMHTLFVAIILLTLGYIVIDFIDNFWLGCTESAILYLAAVVGAGFYWLGSILKNK